MIKILFLAANPSDILPLKLDEESRSIDLALRQSEFGDLFEIKQHWAVRVSDIQGLLLRHKPDIVHFSGHGSAANEIILQDGSGQSQVVPAAGLEQLFLLLKDNIRCIILNACYSESQAQAIAKHIDCVIGMSTELSDLAAISFATAFYQAIGFGRNIQAAFDLGCLQISLENLGEQHIPKILSIKSDPSCVILAADKASSTQIDSSQIRYKPTSEPTNRTKDRAESGNQDQNVSESIRIQLAKINKVIDTLTNDQYRIIQWLRGHKRASISGCAGSGKTLVAIEKAIRLDRAGLKTLMLCHNPNLAKHLSYLVAGTGVSVFDFTKWVAILTDQVQGNSDGWTNFEEPLQADIDEAFDVLVDSRIKYDAIIVDEAQDFRDTWWLLIDAAFVHPDEGILYIFHDDNQTLLPHRGQYPIHDAPFPLSKNCRNAGKIFELVRRIHPHAPEISTFLAEQGIVKYSVFESGSEQSLVINAIQSALPYFSPTQIVVLTTESGPLEHSILNNIWVEEKTKWHWQDSVETYLNIIETTNGRLSGIVRPTLSNALYPTSEDIELVSNFAQKIVRNASKPIDSEFEQVYFKWFVKNDQLTLNLRRFISPLRLAIFFSSKTWAEGIPQPLGYQLAHSQDYQRESIILHSVATFKGLESECVVLFIRALRDELDAHLYVGLSRSRFYLHLVVDSQLASRFPSRAWSRYLLEMPHSIDTRMDASLRGLGIEH